MKGLRRDGPPASCSSKIFGCWARCAIQALFTSLEQVGVLDLTA